MHVSRDPPIKLLGAVRGSLSTDRLFETPTHQEVLADLSGALAKAPGLSALTGEAGLGKTTLVRQAITGWPGPVRVAENAHDLFDALAALSGSPKGRTPGILVVENVHDLPAEALERLGRLDAKTMPHIILVGQSTLWGRLQGEALRPLRDRIDQRCVLFPLSHGEAERYVEHLFRLGGAGRDQILGDRDRHAMLLAARGNLRRINAELLVRLAQVRDRSGGAVSGSDRARWPGRKAPGLRVLAGTLAVLAVLGGSLLAVAPELAAPLLSVFPGPSMPVTVPGPADPAAPLPAAMQPDPLVREPVVAEPPIPELAVPQPAVPEPAVPEPAIPRPAVPGPAVPEPPVPGPALPVGPASSIPPEPQAGSAPAAAAVPALPDEVVAVLVRRGEAMMELHDVSAARRFFERAALDGSGALRARAALNFAATYDPGEGGPGAWVEDKDAAVALAWYRLAASLGQPEAEAAVKRLSGQAR